jgi:hypothetical protein
MYKKSDWRCDNLSLLETLCDSFQTHSYNSAFSQFGQWFGVKFTGFYEFLSLEKLRIPHCSGMLMKNDLGPQQIQPIELKFFHYFHRPILGRGCAPPPFSRW